MASVQVENSERRNALIRKDYDKMYAQKKFLSTYIFEVLGEKYFKSASTIMQIVFRKGHYKSKEDEEN